MNKFVKYMIVLGMLFSANAQATNVYTIISDSSAPCFKSCPLIGLYIGLNVGYSWFNFALHRPEVNDLLPIRSNNFIKESDNSFIPTLGFDFYPCTKTPLRIEINYFYSDIDYKLDPLFQPLFEEETFARDRFLVRNTMGTLYLDWHTCTGWVPYAGISGGVANLKSYHQPGTVSNPLPLVYNATESNFSWGATLGTRYFFTQYLFANVQLRYNNLGELIFKNFAVEENLAPNHIEYQSDYLHETTFLAGIGYVF
ncbi:MAG: hypothetical protein H0U71_03585 [Gammaproteobacteria bacterium]|nr:hypothetical protein [Gammaproteobacteria bacterium]